MTEAALGECPARFWLEALSAGEQIPEAAERHVPSCGRCTQAIEALSAERDAFLATRSPAGVVLKARERAARQRRSWLPAWAGGLAATAMFLYSFVVVPDGGYREKGARFEALYRRDAQAQPVTAHVRLKAGDALRFLYRPSGAGYLMILDVDGLGRVQPFFPFEGKAAAAVSPAMPALLPGSVALDAAPGPEHLVAVFSAAPFELAGLEVTPRGALAPEVRCAGCSLDFLVLQKEP